MASRARILATLAVVGLLAACAGGEPDLLTLSDAEPGPDEFGIVPNRPLEQPRDLAELPVPTPGGANRSDLDPLGDATRALGGTPGGATAPVQGEALIAATGRYGTDPAIRSELAAQDRAFREANRGPGAEPALQPVDLLRRLRRPVAGPVRGAGAVARRRHPHPRRAAGGRGEPLSAHNPVGPIAAAGPALIFPGTSRDR